MKNVEPYNFISHLFNNKETKKKPYKSITKEKNLESLTNEVAIEILLRLKKQHDFNKQSEFEE